MSCENHLSDPPVRQPPDAPKPPVRPSGTARRPPGTGVRQPFRPRRRSAGGRRGEGSRIGKIRAI